jgi:putative membrane protein
MEMVFVDNLGFELVSLPIASLLIVYITGRGYMAGKSGNFTTVRNVMKEGAVSLGLLGAIFTILALWGEMTWTLPGSYNILFDDPYLLMGIIFLAFSISVLLDKGASTSGIFALISGLFTIWYGVNGYWLGMTKEPLALLGMYGLYGLAGIASYPAMRVVDALLSQTNQQSPEIQAQMKSQMVIHASVQIPAKGAVKQNWLVRHQLLIFSAFWVLVLAAGILSGYVAINTIPAHLKSAP